MLQSNMLQTERNCAALTVASRSEQVEWERSKIDVVQHALRTAPNICECLIGAVLNKTDIRAMARYKIYTKDYYSESRYARYGFSDPS
jgi:polysaccharide biosynthesis transport protein